VLHSICAEVLKLGFRALHSISSSGAPIQFLEETRKIKLAAYPSLKLSYSLFVAVLEQESASQSHGKRPTVLRPALWAADESGRVYLGAEGRSWAFNFSLSQTMSFGCGYLDAFLRALVQHSFLSFSCALLTPFNFSFASVEGATRRLDSLSNYAEPSFQLSDAQCENDFGDCQSFGEGVSARYVTGVLDSILLHQISESCSQLRFECVSFNSPAVTFEWEPLFTLSLSSHAHRSRNVDLCLLSFENPNPICDGTARHRLEGSEEDHRRADRQGLRCDQDLLNILLNGYSGQQLSQEPQCSEEIRYCDVVGSSSDPHYHIPAFKRSWNATWVPGCWKLWRLEFGRQYREELGRRENEGQSNVRNPAIEIELGNDETKESGLGTDTEDAILRGDLTVQQPGGQPQSAVARDWHPIASSQGIPVERHILGNFRDAEDQERVAITD
jgi:hypothetical protein